MKIVLLAAMALAVALPAAAATPSAAKKNAGSWTMSGAKEGDRSCTLKFKSQGAIGGWGLDVPHACVKAFPRLQNAAAWTLYPDGSIGFIDPRRQRIYRFDKTQDGDFITSPNKDGKQFVLAKGTGDKELTPKERMSGGWSLKGMGGAPRCVFTSKSNAAGTEGTLTMQPGCAKTWRSKGWTSWIQKGGRMTLLDAKGAELQTFKKADMVTYEGKAKNGDVIYFARD